MDARTAHFIKRPGDGAMFGWPADFMPDVSEEQRAETLTDDIVRPAYAVLDEVGTAALPWGLDSMLAALGSGTV